MSDDSGAAICPVCAAPNQTMRFCLECGARLRQPIEPRRRRRPRFATPTRPTDEIGFVRASAQQPVAEVVAREQLRTLRRRLVLGEVHGDRVAEVTGRRRPDSGIIAGLIIVAMSIVVAFAIGFASVAIARSHQQQATTTSSAVVMEHP